MDISERVQKQHFLRDEIFNKGLDVKAFKQMLIVSKTDGENIDNWSMEELT